MKSELHSVTLPMFPEAPSKLPILEVAVTT